MSETISAQPTTYKELVDALREALPYVASNPLQGSKMTVERIYSLLSRVPPEERQ